MILRLTLHANLKVALLLASVPAAIALAAAPPASATAAYDAYVRTVQSRLSSPSYFPASASAESLHSSEPAVQSEPVIVIVSLTPSGATELPGALLHHWRATAFVPAASALDLERLLKDVRAYPRLFAPQVMDARIIATHGDRLQLAMRARQRHVVTVVLDADYDVAFAQPDPRHGSCFSHSIHMREIASPGTAAEHALGPDEEHGFLWRQDTFWNWEERDGGLSIQVESVSLTRSIPRGLAWAVAPYVESIPRESLEFTLRAICGALRRQ